MSPFLSAESSLETRRPAHLSCPAFSTNRTRSARTPVRWPMATMSVLRCRFSLVLESCCFNCYLHCPIRKAPLAWETRAFGSSKTIFNFANGSRPGRDTLHPSTRAAICTALFLERSSFGLGCPRSQHDRATERPNDKLRTRNDPRVRGTPKNANC